jgi:hypothetical protein
MLSPRIKAKEKRLDQFEAFNPPCYPLHLQG